jgi:hypothetical protein
MFPPVSTVQKVEMIRDGGSLSIIYESEGRGRFILFTKLIMEREGGAWKKRGYSAPFVIDCDPAKRPPNTDKIIYGELSGPAEPISWAEARAIVDAASSLATGLREWESRWLKMLQYVTANDGALPPA